MTERSVIAKRLNDMLMHIDGALATVGNADFAAYQASYQMKRAVERSIEIISEASKHIPDHIKAEHPEVPWPKIKTIGNVFRHKYWDVDDHVVWLTITISLRELRPTIVKLLEKYQRS